MSCSAATRRGANQRIRNRTTRSSQPAPASRLNRFHAALPRRASTATPLWLPFAGYKEHLRLCVNRVSWCYFRSNSTASPPSNPFLRKRRCCPRYSLLSLRSPGFISAVTKVVIFCRSPSASSYNFVFYTLSACYVLLFCYCRVSWASGICLSICLVFHCVFRRARNAANHNYHHKMSTELYGLHPEVQAPSNQYRYRIILTISGVASSVWANAWAKRPIGFSACCFALSRRDVPSLPLSVSYRPSVPEFSIFIGDL